MDQSLLVLVVDDDPDNLVRIEAALRPLGLVTLHASNGVEALAVLAEHRGRHGFQGIVISDLKMPELDGVGLLRRLQDDDKQLPVILVSAYGDIEVAVNAMRGGAFHFVERPIDFEHLRSLVADALASRQRVLAERKESADRANRRLAAILFADAVDYSRMSHRDEEATRLQFRALQRDVFEHHIADNHGRLVKMLGDGFLIEFPSVVNAVACAIAIQKTLVESLRDGAKEGALQLRIGVNLGDVILEEDDVFGDGVNVAVRLEGEFLDAHAPTLRADDELPLVRAAGLLAGRGRGRQGEEQGGQDCGRGDAE
jgi:FixJ family two-component response regulator